jgi:MFS family permease
MFSYGALAVVLVLYLASLGLDPLTIGAILTLSLIGDTLISLWLTTNADRLGRRRVLIAGAALMAIAGIAFALTSVVALLILAATIGVISPTGNEVGPFLAVEQAALSETTPTCGGPRRSPGTTCGLRGDGGRSAVGRRRDPGPARRRLGDVDGVPRDRHRVRG